MIWGERWIHDTTVYLTTKLQTATTSFSHSVQRQLKVNYLHKGSHSERKQEEPGLGSSSAASDWCGRAGQRRSPPNPVPKEGYFPLGCSFRPAANRPEAAPLLLQGAQGSLEGAVMHQDVI